MFFALKPSSFMNFKAKALPYTTLLSFILIGLGLYWVFFLTPPDYQQGECVRILFVHVPAAWLCLGIYGAMGVMSLMGLVTRQPTYHVICRSSAFVGLTFNIICLVTGSLWGKPMWGTWWVWDARLTSVAVLALLYVGYILLTNLFDDPEEGSRKGAFLLIVGLLNLPVIKWSVNWWNTLHQPASVFRADGPHLAPEFLYPLGIMALGFGLLALSLILLRTSTTIQEMRSRSILMQELRRKTYGA